MRSFIFTLGFHEDYIERRLHESSATREDEIILFTAKPAIGGVLRAYESLKARAHSIGLRKPKLVELDCQDMAEAILQARKTIHQLPEPIIADLSGGMRVTIITVYTALLLENKKFKLYIQPEGSMELHINIPSQIIELIRNPLTQEKKKTLKTIMENPGITVREIAETLGKKEKTILNHLTELKKKQLVKIKGRSRGLYPTKWAKTICPHPE